MKTMEHNNNKTIERNEDNGIKEYDNVKEWRQCKGMKTMEHKNKTM